MTDPQQFPDSVSVVYEDNLCAPVYNNPFISGGSSSIPRQAKLIATERIKAGQFISTYFGTWKTGRLLALVLETGPANKSD